MKTEISSGGLVVKKTGKDWQILLIRDMNDTWTFPKGLIETGETREAAAKREIGEETGLTSLTMIQPLKTISYYFKRGGLVYKTVHYFLFKTEGSSDLKGQKEEGISEARWYDMTKAIDIIGYPKTNRELLRQANKILVSISG